MIIPADIEYIVAQSLGDIPAGPPPVPAGMVPPYVVVWRTGGDRYAVAIDRNLVSIDVYADDWGAAVELAGRAVGAVAAMQGELCEGVQIGAVTITTLPYTNPDPNNPTIPRVTFAAEIISKAITTE